MNLQYIKTKLEIAITGIRGDYLRRAGRTFLPRMGVLDTVSCHGRPKALWFSQRYADGTTLAIRSRADGADETFTRTYSYPEFRSITDTPNSWLLGDKKQQQADIMPDFLIRPDEVEEYPLWPSFQRNLLRVRDIYGKTAKIVIGPDGMSVNGRYIYKGMIASKKLTPFQLPQCWWRLADDRQSRNVKLQVWKTAAGVHHRICASDWILTGMFLSAHQTEPGAKRK